MKLNQEQTSTIIDAFSKMKSKNDLLLLLNYAKSILYRKESIDFGINHLNYHQNPNIRGRYHKFKILKKSGGERLIHSPNIGLKIMQRCLSLIFQAIYEPNPAATGFVQGISIVDNAKVHAGSIYIFNIDLKDFFSSIDQARVWGRLQHPPFNLNKKNNRLELANIIASLCCHKVKVERLNDGGDWEETRRNVLPQGAPTSPMLINIICQRLDFYLTAVAKRFGLKYTRYADDITFSSMHNVYQENSDFLKELNRIINNENFHIKESKTRLQKKEFSQEVTGLIVNKIPNVRKRYIKQIRLWLHYWEKNGHKIANQMYTEQYINDKGHVKSKVPDISSVLRGKLNFLKMVKGENDSTYIKLFERFKKLAEKNSETKLIKFDNKTDVVHSPVETVKFLKYFKYDNSFNFKDLVHKPVDENFDFIKLIESSISQFVKISTAPNGKLILPKNLIREVQRFFNILHSEGVKFFNEIGHHPLDDNKIGTEIQMFKGKYRFGNERSESSILSDLIINTATTERRTYIEHNENIINSFSKADTSGRFNSNQILFNPDLKKFQSKANFFTWVPNVTITLASIFENILKHSNIEGNRNFDSSDKQIIISLDRQLVGDVIKIELTILDKYSLFQGNIDTILSDMRRDYVPPLVSICDFEVQFVTINNEFYQCRVLPYSDKISPLNESPEGFKYILTFYD